MKSLSKITLLLFITGACSTEKSSKNAAEEGANIALKRLGDISGMTLWDNRVSFHVDSLLRKNVKYLYFSEDQYKEVLAQSYHGKAENYDKTTGMPNGEFIDFDDEVVAQITEEGHLKISTNFTLYNDTGVAIQDFDGFTKIYTFTPVKEEYKISIKDNGSGNWETKTDMVIRYYLIKEKDNTLLMIDLDKPTKGDSYAIGYNTLEEATQNISKSSIYTR